MRHTGARTRDEAVHNLPRAVGWLLRVSLVALALVGCNNKTATPASFVQTAGPYTATLRVEPYPPVPMDDAALELTLLDSDDTLVSGAEIRFDLTMPAMEMPKNQPSAAEVSDGVYRAQTIFTMAGIWQVLAWVSRDGETQELRYIVDVP